jgi:hypothetical protein
MRGVKSNHSWYDMIKPIFQPNPTNLILIDKENYTKCNQQTKSG